MHSKKVIFASLLAAAFFSFVFTAVASAKTTTFNVSVTADLLYVRSGPGKSYGKVAELRKGAVVKVYEQNNGWYRIDSGKKWVMAEYVKKTTAAVSSQAAKTPAKITTYQAAATSTVSTTMSAADSARCVQAIKTANSYCKSVASGCSSFSTTPKCLEANKQCEERQQIAFEQCPQ